MKKMLFIVGMLISLANVQGQYVTDALNYSLNFPAITARSLSMGGAFTSLGGDYASALINPAGLGLYRKSEFQFTPAESYSKTVADYLGQKNDDFRYQFNLGSISYVGNYHNQKEHGLFGVTYAVGYTRQNNFNNNTLIRGTNSANSLTDYFMQNAQGTRPENLDAFYERLAFDAYVIDTIPGSPTSYQTPVLLPITQRKTISTRGGIGEWNFALGFNFGDVFYAGMGLGIHQLRLDNTAVHSEFDTGLNDFNRFSFTEDLHVVGSGFNMNMGMIVRLAKILRLGASFQMPTYYKIEEHYYNTLYSEFDNGDNYTVYPTDANGDKLAEGNFKYKLTTPLKAQGGLSIQLGKMGMISADLEYVDYATMRLRENDSYTDFSDANQNIKDVYKSVVNLKLGGEVKLDKVSLRLGGGYYPSPCQSIAQPGIFQYIGNVPGAYTEISTGVGYRTDSFFFDLGFSRLYHSEKYNLYFDNTATLNQTQYRFLASIGFRF